MALPLASQTVVLNDGTRATIHPVWDGSQLPLELVAALCVEYNAEVDRGRSFPETQKLMLENFEKSWFAGVSGVMVKGDDESHAVLEDFDLLDTNECLGSFWIQPCFPGRSSHICTANFLTRSKFRNLGVGKAMAQCFMRWALQLGYDYALFTLVYDCNVAACRILNKLGFNMLGALRGAGILKGFNYPVDAFMFGRPLSAHAITYGTPGAHSIGTLAGYSPAYTPGGNLSTAYYSPPGQKNSLQNTSPQKNSTQSSSTQNNTTQSSSNQSSSTQSNSTQSNSTQSSSTQSSSTQSNSSWKTTSQIPAVQSSSIQPNSIHPSTLLPSNLDPALQPASVQHNNIQPLPSLRTQLPQEFENLRTYIVSGTYPTEANRTERTRIRSRARSYEVENGVLLFKRTRKPVIADENEQIRITTTLHRENHNGINKLQKQIMDSYHWQGVRDTIQTVIKNCPECRENSRPQDNMVVTPQFAPPSQKSLQPMQQPILQPPHHSPQQYQQQWQQSYSSLDAPVSDYNYFPQEIVYLPPENEDDEYVPEDDMEDQIRYNENDKVVDDNQDQDDIDDSLFKDEDDDDEWTEPEEEEEDDEDDEVIETN